MLAVKPRIKLRKLLDNHGLVDVLYLALLEVGFVFPRLTSKKEMRLNQASPFHSHARALAVPAKRRTTTNLAPPYAIHKSNLHSLGTISVSYLGEYSFLMIDIVQMGL